MITQFYNKATKKFEEIDTHSFECSVCGHDQFEFLPNPFFSNGESPHALIQKCNACKNRTAVDKDYASDRENYVLKSIWDKEHPPKKNETPKPSATSLPMTAEEAEKKRQELAQAEKDSNDQKTAKILENGMTATATDTTESKPEKKKPGRKPKNATK